MDIRISFLLIGVVSLGGLLMLGQVLDFTPKKAETARETTLSPSISVIPTTPKDPGAPFESSETFSDVAVSTPQVIVEVEPEVKPIASRQYIEVNAGCDPYWGGECLNVRSGPGTEYPSVYRLRNGVVLASSGTVEVNGEKWYRIIFDEWVRYPQRISGEWYVAAAYVQSFSDVGTLEASGEETVPEKRIVIDRSEQKLYAYEGEALFMEEPISTGLDFTPTPRGTFSVFKKTPSRYMQGPLPGISNDYYDLPGVPWNLYFTEAGGAIHGTYWHDKFGQQWSHGCVNLPPETARKLYKWAPIGTTVVVQD